MAYPPDITDSSTNVAARFPRWLRQTWPVSGDADTVRDILASLSLNTVCRSAQCPNQGECWSRGTATFMILGDVCTRDCSFCGVSTGAPLSPAPDEGERVAAAVSRLGIRHAVVTSVTRDDLSDGGAGAFADVIAQIRARCPAVSVEVLTPDFSGDPWALQLVVQAKPDVFAHNVETVPRLHTLLRDPRASYERSLEVLGIARETLPSSALVKSGLMVGCGETPEEITTALADLRAVGCDAVTIGQYLKPRDGRAPVTSFVPPEQFARYEEVARALGFRFALAGPFVRSSYHADRLCATTPDPTDVEQEHNLLPTPPNLA